MPTNVTGSVRYLDTSSPGANSVVRFWLRGTRNNVPVVPGTGAIAPQADGTQFYVDIPADASGNVSGSIYSTRDAAGNGNGDIEVAGSFTAVYYGMQLINNNIPGPEVPIHAKQGVTLDISSVTAISTTPVIPAPTGDVNYARLDQSNFSNDKTVAFSSTPTFDCSGSLIAILFEITLTGDVTAPTLVNAKRGQIITFKIIQDGTGGHSFTYPSNVKGGMSVDGTASAVNVQSFQFDGSNAYPLGNLTVN